MDHGQTEWRSIRRVVSKGVLLISPFALLMFLEWFVLPLDLFTFRIWEAALASPYRYPGPFLPDLTISKKREYGDRYRSGDPAMIAHKPVTWYTDHFGWRNRPEIEQVKTYDAVVIGDSNIVGAFLDQKDTLSETLSKRGEISAYSYSYGSDHISLFFSDPRMVQKAPRLVVVESKVHNWSTNTDYLANFRQLPDGSLDVKDRSDEMQVFLSSARDRSRERLHAIWTKRPMFHWLKASLRADFVLPQRAAGGRIAGTPALAAGDSAESAWRPVNWIVSGGIPRVASSGGDSAIEMRSSSNNAYWHTEAFRAERPDGAIVVRFDARSSIGPSDNTVYVFEDGGYRAIGKIAVSTRWQAYEIRIETRPASRLELQIDVAHDWQWLSIRNFRVVNATDAVGLLPPPIGLPIAQWAPVPAPCEETREACGSWWRDRAGGYVRSPRLPPPGPAGLMIRFEAKADVGSSEFAPVYVFEGPSYRQVTQYAYSPTWKEYRFLVPPSPDRETRVQLDIPPSVGRLHVRNFAATPVRENAAIREGGKP